MSVDEAKNVGDEVEDRETEQGMRSAAFDNFRRSVGLQFGFVLHSGLEAERAIDHVCAAAERLVASQREWQPIETAPKDGARILFYTPSDPETGWLEFVAESFYDKHGLADTFVPQWQDGLEPTHWMPRPEPPALTKGSEQ